jgi:hypothetical protein
LPRPGHKQANGSKAKKAHNTRDNTGVPSDSFSGLNGQRATVLFPDCLGQRVELRRSARHIPCPNRKLVSEFVPGASDRSGEAMETLGHLGLALLKDMLKLVGHVRHNMLGLVTGYGRDTGCGRLYLISDVGQAGWAIVFLAVAN